MNIRNLLIESMRSFSCKELQRFDKFLRSSYFRKAHFNNTKVYELFKILKSYFLKLVDSKNTSSQHIPIVNWEKIMKTLFTPPQKGQEKKLSKLCSELICYIIEFLAVENLINRQIDFRISLSEEILKRNLSCLFEHSWKVKYFDGIYSEDEVKNIYHRYRLINIANIHKEKCKDLRPDYELELMLFKKYKDKINSELEEKRKSHVN